MRSIIGFLVASTIAISGAYAQDVATTEASVKRPWTVGLSTQTTMGLSKDATDDSTNVGALGQRTVVDFTYDFAGSDISLLITQPFYNSWIEAGENAKGNFTLGNTELNYKNASIGELGGVNFSAGFRTVIPTELLTEKNSVKRNTGFITYVMPSLKAKKAWGKFALSGKAASRLYFFSKEESEVWADVINLNTKEKVEAKIGTSANRLFRQYLTATASYNILENLSVSTSGQFELDMRHKLEGSDKRSIKPQFMVVPEISITPVENLSVDLGFAIGGSPSLDPMNFEDVWANDNLKNIAYNSAAYARVGYTF